MLSGHLSEEIIKKEAQVAKKRAERNAQTERKRYKSSFSHSLRRFSKKEKKENRKKKEGRNATNTTVKHCKFLQLLVDTNRCRPPDSPYPGASLHRLCSLLHSPSQNLRSQTLFVHPLSFPSSVPETFPFRPELPVANLNSESCRISPEIEGLPSPFSFRVYK